jgi:protein phosphatase
MDLYRRRFVNFFRDLFRRNKTEHIPATTAVETAPLAEDPPDTPSQPSKAIEMKPPQLIVGMAQSVGLQRDHNEDTLFSVTSMFADGVSDLPFGIHVVADGMGGYMYGEIASGAASRAMGEYLIRHLYLPFLSGQTGPEQESIHEVMEQGMVEAQRAVLASAPGGGTTLTAALIMGDRVTISHVGDSRAYFVYPDGRIQAMTQDHSLVRRLQDLGQIDEQEASVHPQRNVLYRALGQKEPFRPDVNTHLLPAAGFLLLCSDGLWGSVADAEMARIVRLADNPSIACHHLVEAANAAGGPDNISAILIQYLG